MASTINEFAILALGKYMKLTHSRRLLISVSGIPGSGKTTFANSVVQSINEISQLKYGVALARSIPMDGFHLSRDALNKLPNSVEAHQRRGAPFTFDATRLHQLIEQLKEPSFSIIYAPSFDHAIKDPMTNDILILPSQRIIILEGNYLCFQPPPLKHEGNEGITYLSPLWNKIAIMFDEKWVIDTPLDIATSRLAFRHFEAGIVSSLAEGYSRANGSDKRNAEDIIRWRGNYDQIVAQFSV